MFSRLLQAFGLGRFEDVVTLRDHEFMKDRILAVIDDYTPPTIHPAISKTDWDDIDNINDWFNICFTDQDKERIAKYFLGRFQRSCDIGNYWFNQYQPQSGSSHKFHIHGNTDFVMIYFVELQDKRVRTVLKHPKTGKIFAPKVKEGDLLIFPGSIEHSSPPNLTDTRKTIVSFNVNFNDDAC